MQEIALCFSILLSGISLGSLAYVLYDSEQKRKWYTVQVKDLKALMDAQEKSALSFAEKILQLDEKINTLEFRNFRK